MYLASQGSNPVQGDMVDHTKEKSRESGVLAWFNRLSRGRKVILILMTIRAARAVPKWTVAITADGELSAKIMKLFISPRGVHKGAYNCTAQGALRAFPEFLGRN